MRASKPTSGTSARYGKSPIGGPGLRKIDIVVANAAIQRWVPLLEMEDTDWRDVIDNNLNGTANTVRAFAPKDGRTQEGSLILLSSMQGKHGTKMPRATRPRSGASSA